MTNADTEIRVGDVVIACGFSRPVVVLAVEHDAVSGKVTAVRVMNHLAYTSWKKIGYVAKTNKHYPQVEELLGLLKENKP